MRRVETAVNVFNLFDNANSIPNKQFGDWIAQNPHLYRMIKQIGDMVREDDKTN